MKEKISGSLNEIARAVIGRKNTYRLRYFHQHGHFPDLKHPKDISEVMIRDMFNPETCKFYSQFVDKLGLRDYVKSKGLEHILLKHYGVWDTPEEIPFDDLPDRFVLKSNNGCGDHVFCRDKSKLDRDEAIRTLHHAIENGIHHSEPHYTYITPKVYAEELIETPDDDLPMDYKFTCVGGEVMDVFAVTERAVHAKYSTLDLNWTPLPYTRPEFMPKSLPPKPKHIDKLAEVARILSGDFGFVRVDLYEYRDQPYISELTFFPWGGLLYSYTEEAIKLYGKKWNEWNSKKSKKDEFFASI